MERSSGTLWWLAVLAGLPVAVVVEVWVFTPRHLLDLSVAWFFVQQAAILLPALLFLSVAAVLGWRISDRQIMAGTLVLFPLWLLKGPLTVAILLAILALTDAPFAP